jgi:hypothetical protein
MPRSRALCADGFWLDWASCTASTLHSFVHVRSRLVHGPFPFSVGATLSSVPSTSFWVKTRIEGKDLLQADLMLPAIGQMILVHPAFFIAERKIAELHLMRIVAEADSLWFPYPVGLSSHEELMQVLIRPAKSDLKCVMKPSNGAALRTRRRRQVIQ